MRTRFLFLLLIFLICSSAHAEPAQVKVFSGISLGFASVDMEGYDSAFDGSWFVGLKLKRWIELQYGLQIQHKFEQQDDSSNNLSVRGQYFGIGVPVPFDDTLGIRPNIGYYSWTMEATRLGHYWGEEEGGSWQAGLDFTLNFSGGQAAFGWSYINQVSDASINQGKLSVRVYF